MDTSFKGVVARVMDSLRETGLVSDDTAGSVVRTLVEAFAREMATFYAMLDQAHAAGYLDTAEGPALDNVVAVLGIRRAQAGRLRGRVAFSRLSPAPQDIVIPAGLRVTGPDLPDGASVPILETVERATIGRGELEATAAVQEIPDSTSGDWSVLPPGTLTIMPRPVLGVETVTNPDPVTRAGQRESDDALRARASVALRESQRSTGEAIEAAAREHGLEQVTVREPEDGSPGRVEVLIGDPGFEQKPGRQARLRETIRAVKAAGVRMDVQYLRSVYLQPTLTVEPEDPELDDGGFERLAAALRQALANLVAGSPAGAPITRRKLDAALMSQPAVRDVEVSMRTFMLEYPDDPELEPKPVEDTGKREIPSGDWYLEPLERAVVDLAHWPPPVQRRPAMTARLDLIAIVKNTDLLAATLRETIRATVDAHVARLVPEPSGDRRLSQEALVAQLRERAFLDALRLARVTHAWNGLVEDLTPDHDVRLQVGERLSVGELDIVQGESQPTGATPGVEKVVRER